MTEKRIDHLANAVKYETNTPILRQRRISLLGFDPAAHLPVHSPPPPKGTANGRR